MPEEPNGEYTRMKASIQLGEGIDRRGDIQVEIVRSIDDSDARKRREVVLPDGSTITARTTDAIFAEFYFEVGRATRTLRQHLGLDEDREEEADGDDDTDG